MNSFAFILNGTVKVDHKTDKFTPEELGYFNTDIQKFIFRYASGWKLNRMKIDLNASKTDPALVIPEQDLWVSVDLEYDDGSYVNDQSILNVCEKGLFKNGTYSHKKYDSQNLIKLDKETLSATFFFRIEETSNDMKKVHKGRGFVVKTTLAFLDDGDDYLKNISNTIGTCSIIALSKFKDVRSGNQNVKKRKLNNYGDEKVLSLKPEAKLEKLLV
jgi:hypothetical protein